MEERAERIIDLYERHARDWDADRNFYADPWNDKPWHDRFVAALPAGASILDLGCGSGWPVARYLVERGFRVTGVDSSPTLISLCRQRLSDQEWLIGDMRGLQLPRQFDGVLAWDSFFHLRPDDQRQMFNVFAQHAAPSAVLMFNSGPAYGEGVGEYRGDPLYHASLNTDEYTALLSIAGFEVIVHAVEDWQTGGGRTVWLTRSRLNRVVAYKPKLEVASGMAPRLLEKRRVNLRLIHNGVQPGVPLDEPMRFGVQDTKGEVHPGLTTPGDARDFDVVLDVRGDEASPPVFSGAFAHGPSTGRFLYLGWKREGEHEHPWCWRIKIPLSGISWAEIRTAEKPGNCLAANVIGRRPHASQPITWRIEPVQKS